jgi:hypothetical protein
VFDLSDQNDWIEDVEGMARIGAPGRRYRTYRDKMEHLFQNDLLIKILEGTNGDSRLEEHLGIPGSRSRRWRTRHKRTHAGGLGATREKARTRSSRSMTWS